MGTKPTIMVDVANISLNILKDLSFKNIDISDESFEKYQRTEISTWFCFLMKMEMSIFHSFKFFTCVPEILDVIQHDVETLVDECHHNINKEGEQIILKVIVESGLLTPEETEESTNICIDASADFIKTSTGMVAIGAELNKVKIMRDIIEETGSNMKIKASGGVNKNNIDSFAPYVDRFGMGWKAVDELNGLGINNDNY